MMSRSVEKRILQRIAERRAKRRTDYIDFNLLPREVVAVAIDGLPTYGRDGKVVHEAGRPIAYFAPVAWNETMERWESRELAPRRPGYVPAEAITGPLPPARESMRRRPC
ncbi:MAG: hypothetical protein PHS14_19475 [Elusimicrobia bacterium]|nr:hypothetical protein [Elusimicrobiota bacterium]